MKKKLLFSMVIVAVTANYSFAQKWEKTNPDILYSTDKHGNVSNVKVGIGTITPNFSLEVKGKIVTDSMHIHGSLQIGDSTFAFVPNVGSPLTDHIRSDNGMIAIMNGNTSTYNSNIKVGIGLTTPNNTIQVKDLINFHPINFSTFLGYLAGNNGSTGTRNTFVGNRAGNANDKFKI